MFYVIIIAFFIYAWFEKPFKFKEKNDEALNKQFKNNRFKKANTN
jgi:hypothetical protein